jgi:DNA-binding SARP family transcriptional activator
MDFSLLGPVEATEDGQPIPLGGPRQRALLARLLIDANRVVSSERLAADLWDSLPQDAHGALQNHVSRLRKALGDRLATKPPGYLIRVEPGELDLDVFRSRVAEAGGLADPRERSRVLREADALFGGQPLADVDAPFAETERAALEELRLAACEGRIDADLERGRHAELVAELGMLVRTHPLRERLRGQLILALYRCGRQADALEAYRDARRTLDQELGLEPSPALRELERAILTHDESLAAASSIEDQRPSEPPSPKPAPSSSRRTWPVVAGICASLGLAAASIGLALSMRSHASAKEPPTRASSPPTHHATKKAPQEAVHHAVAKRTVRKVEPTTIVLRQETVTQTVSSLQAAPRVTPTTATTTKRTATPAHRSARPTTTTRDTSPVQTMSDDFSESSPNYSLWNVGSGGDGTGSTWALQNGQLVFTIPASAQTGGQYNQVGPVWGSMCRFEGNFDAQVDYRLLDWPRASGAILGLAAWIFRGSDFSGTSRSSGVSENYAGNIDGGFDSVNTADTSGTLRIARVNGMETTYYLANGAWVKLHAALNPGETQLGLQLFATATDWQHVDVSVALDNFTVTAKDVICP